MVKMKSLTAICCVVALMVPSMAFAQASDEGYGGAGGVAGQVETNGGDGGDDGGAPVTTADSESLPFTGAELGVLAAAGGMLVLLGFGLRRLTHGAARA
jgi:hypothetical protein